MAVDLDFCGKLPKVELHAHLGGSLSEKTVQGLLSGKPGIDQSAARVVIGKGHQRTMDECFEMFRILHEIVDSADMVKQATKDVINDFAMDGVQYLELRSTPRDNPKTGLNKRSYIESVLSGINEYEHDNVNNNRCIDVRYLPSLDRGQNIENAFETVKLAEEFKVSSSKVVGIDLSGNPYQGNIGEFLPPLNLARRAELKLSIHTAEVPGYLDDDWKLLQVLPERIGHGTYIIDRDKSHEMVLKNKIPLELCISSNIKTQTSPLDHRKHHITTWLESKHPCVVCTDDKGVFSTTLSYEYSLAASALGYKRSEMFKLSYDAIDHIFADENTKENLRKSFLEIKPGLLAN
uniref:Adenosine deaminase-like protein n=1 Tax=Phallusia mammillata TaxID=59560 RepID=A0A6F9D5B0_9ASCI|nr:adenosine deaminase-like protein [Phallusia mammillata]